MIIRSGEGEGIRGIVIQIDGDLLTIVNLFKGSFIKHKDEVEIIHT